MKFALKIFAAVIFLILVIVFGPYVTWRQCSICGVQEYERGIFGVKISAISEEEYDEYGTYALWKERNRKSQCDHKFSAVENNEPLRTLEKLKSH